MTLKHNLIRAGFGLFRATGAHRLVGHSLRGMGAILTFHRIRPARPGAYAPNGILEITPEFFDAVLTRLERLGVEIVSLDEAVERSRRGSGNRFAVLTFDDGFADVVDYGLPIMERHKAPFTFYVTAGLADRTTRLWWVELEQAIARLDQIVLESGGARLDLPATNDKEKSAAFQAVYDLLRAGGEQALLDDVARLAEAAGLDQRTLVEEACLDWAALANLARHELATIAAHSLSHPRLRAAQLCRRRVRKWRTAPRASRRRRKSLAPISLTPMATRIWRGRANSRWRLNWASRAR